MNALNIGAAGLMAASNRFQQSAVRTATGKGDLVEETVEQVSAKTAFAANAAVIRTADEMSKRLLDLKV